jgi:hypothetical protein
LRRQIPTHCNIRVDICDRHTAGGEQTALIHANREKSIEHSTYEEAS